MQQSTIRIASQDRLWKDSVEQQITPRCFMYMYIFHMYVFET